MIQKIQSLWPEIVLFATACVVMVVGISPSVAVRRSCGVIAGLGLALAGLVAIDWPGPASSVVWPALAPYVKVLVAGVGVLLLLVLAGLPDREYEAAVAHGQRYDPIRANRAEFYAFFLFSIMGVMLVSGAEDLIWLFLALELTSLPTYIMVAISSSRNRSLEAGVKYFFLGALGAALFLYGFALLYGATGSTNLETIRQVIAQQRLGSEAVNGVALAGALLAVIGVGFKIAAVPMHFYTADVYQGAASPVTAFLAFVPKTAGFVALILLLTTIGWGYGPSGQSLPEPIRTVLWVIAAMTMTVGNVLAVVQSSVKRVLAYSSIAHSGYMLVGLVAGPGPAGAPFARNGIAAILFYLLCYGVMNLGAFAVMASLERRSRSGATEEADSIDDLRGLCTTRPMLGWIMVVSAVGLLGMPPLLGFFGKLPLFTSGIGAGEIPLVVVLGINSAIAAYYYLRLAALALLEDPDVTPVGGGLSENAPPGRKFAGFICAAAVIGLSALAWPLINLADGAAKYEPRLTPGSAVSAREAPIVPSADALTEPRAASGRP
ncbi:MAG: NADH-quinone oxidoreductase subunit N [Phycisphaerae bacterium]|nr:NADH-quinone oxidoreductase subunit N [Phycisphaerae bacterium]